MDVLTASRVCGLALNTMTSQLGLGNLAHHFDGENVEEFALLLPEVRVLRNGRSVASIELTDSTTHGTLSYDLLIVFPDVYNLVRSKHVSEFRPEEYGLHINTARNWLGEKEPDLVVEWSITPDQVRRGPARPTFKSQLGTRKPGVKRSM